LKRRTFIGGYFPDFLGFPISVSESGDGLLCHRLDA
jgi:hypothetical protein